ncbi:MAG: beta-ketoacyl-ACP synthase [Deltaproteobacteria bacterium]|nr:beta-ketoacyl-ACP synthase [Deltaproteobacteria bacterium]
MSDGAWRGYPITAWSTVNSLGANTGEVMSALRSGQAALSPPPSGTSFKTVCGVVNADLAALPKALKQFDSRNNRFVQQALFEIEFALEAARERWGPERIGICVGSSTAAMDEIENAYAQHAEGGSIPSGFDVFASGSFDGLVRALRALTHLDGPAAVVSNACASSGKAFASAKRWMDAGIVDAVLVGGADSLCQITLRGFRSLGLISSEPTRPFSRERRGINIGEGAAFALLERRGQGPRLLGTGESGDAHHMTTPDPEGRGAQRAMKEAIADAGVLPGDIDYVNAHGTGTAFNDAMEARAIRATLGDRANPIVVSTKGYVGHTLGAAGAIEAVFVLESLRNKWIPGSVGADPLDPEIGLNVPTASVDAEVRVALSNSFAFGGSNVSLVFGAPE